jgi:hypothetical protein
MWQSMQDSEELSPSTHDRWMEEYRVPKSPFMFSCCTGPKAALLSLVSSRKIQKKKKTPVPQQPQKHFLGILSLRENEAG